MNCGSLTTNALDFTTPVDHASSQNPAVMVSQIKTLLHSVILCRPLLALAIYLVFRTSDKHPSVKGLGTEAVAL